MPAYSQVIVKRTCYRCGRPATREVYNTVNALVGYFCSTHATEKVIELNKDLKQG